MLEYTLKPQISLPPEPSPDDDQASPTDPADSNEDGEDSTADGDNTAPAVDSASDEADNNEAPVDADAEGARRALPNTQDLLKSIKSSNNFSQRVSYMNIAIETVQ